MGKGVTMTYPITVTEAESTIYNQWAMLPDGIPYDDRYCAMSVPVDAPACISKQCHNKPGYGPDQLYCSRHAHLVTQKETAPC